jgi:eukaryotic-like serine/threonine-protein kinase
MMSGLFGPFLLVPAVAATNTMFFAMVAEPRHRPWLVAAGILAIALPVAAEGFGLLPPAYLFQHGEIHVMPRGASFPEIPTSVSLFIISVAVVILPALIVSQMRDALTAAERRLVLQAWHLGQMLPAAARPALNPQVNTGEVRLPEKR